METIKAMPKPKHNDIGERLLIHEVNVNKNINRINANKEIVKHDSNVDRMDSEVIKVNDKSVTKVKEQKDSKSRRLTSRYANTLFLLLRMSLKFDVLWKQWLLCILIGCVTGYREQKFAMEPQDQVSSYIHS